MSSIYIQLNMLEEAGLYSLHACRQSPTKHFLVKVANYVALYMIIIFVMR